METTRVKGSLCHKQDHKGNYQMLEVPDAPGHGLEKCLLSVSQKVPSNAFSSSSPPVYRVSSSREITLPTLHKEYIAFPH